MGKKHHDAPSEPLLAQENERGRKVKLEIILGQHVPNGEIDSVYEIISCIAMGLRVRGHQAVVSRPMILPPIR